MAPNASSVTSNRPRHLSVQRLAHHSSALSRLALIAAVVAALVVGMVWGSATRGSQSSVGGYSSAQSVGAESSYGADDAPLLLARKGRGNKR